MNFKYNIMKVRKQSFDSQELAMLFQAFSKNLFVRPRKGDVQSVVGNSSVLYFDLSYYDALKEDIQKAYREGKYKKSNAEAEWTRLMENFLLATTEEMPMQCVWEDYSESVNSFW